MSDLDTRLAEELAGLESQPAADTEVHPEDGDQDPADDATNDDATNDEEQRP